MLSMGYTESEFEEIKNEDFTTYFMCSIGARPNIIDVLTILHHTLNFDEAQKYMVSHKVNNDLKLKMVSYKTFKDSKLLSRQPMDFEDIPRLEKLRTDL